MTQREHAESGAGTSQCGAILARLEAAEGAWVAMPVLAKASGAFAVHSRVAELRSWGHVIEQRSQRDGRKVRSFYRLVEDAPCKYCLRVECECSEFDVAPDMGDK